MKPPQNWSFILQCLLWSDPPHHYRGGTLCSQSPVSKFVTRMFLHSHWGSWQSSMSLQVFLPLTPALDMPFKKGPAISISEMDDTLLTHQEISKTRSISWSLHSTQNSIFLPSRMLNEQLEIRTVKTQCCLGYPLSTLLDELCKDVISVFWNTCYSDAKSWPTL